MTERFTESLEENACEHGDHVAPMFSRFCSPECEECEATPFDLIERPCAGICAKKGIDTVSFNAGVEAAAKLVEGHSCVASCCDAQPSSGEAKELAACVRKNARRE